MATLRFLFFKVIHLSNRLFWEFWFSLNKLSLLRSLIVVTLPLHPPILAQHSGMGCSTVHPWVDSFSTLTVFQQGNWVTILMKANAFVSSHRSSSSSSNFHEDFQQQFWMSPRTYLFSADTLQQCPLGLVISWGKVVGGSKDNKGLFHHFGMDSWESNSCPFGKAEAKRLTNLSRAATMTRATFLSSPTAPLATAGCLAVSRLLSPAETPATL